MKDPTQHESVENLGAKLSNVLSKLIA
jgi:hypothetical protein